MKIYTALIIGSGFGGMTAALKLKQLGIDDFLILERRTFAGGTWCQNTYPGAAVDVPSTLYSLSTEHFPWTQKLADQAELHSYTEQVMAKHKLRAKTQLGATVIKVQWQEKAQCWQVDTEARGSFRARFLINASGPLSHAKIPDFPGRDSFQGKQSIEVLPEAESNYTMMIHREMEKTVWKSGGCHSWYQSKSGHVIAMFPGFSFTYWRMATSFKPEHHRLA